MTENSPAYGEILDAMKPVFVTCTAGTNAFTDVMVTQCREGVRLNGHPEMVFNRAESAALAMTLLKMTGQVGQ